jgi:hypothetical protein
MRPVIDISGNVYGKLTVIKRIEKPSTIKSSNAWWLCKCKCGKETSANGNDLRRGKILSCGCTHCADLSGMKFSRLTVIEKVISEIKSKEFLWKCRCDCGNIIIVKTSSLTRTNESRQSCGCIRGEKLTMPHGVAARNSVYSRYRLRAKKKGLDFRLSKEFFLTLALQNCFYCGCKPGQIEKHKRGDFVYNTIDRIDSKFGYVQDNVVSCCWKCNRSKMEDSEQEFYKWVAKIFENLKRKNLI